MIDPDLKYCPQCDDEYMPVAETCAACEIHLITGRERLERENAVLRHRDNRKGALTAGEDLVTVYRGSLTELKKLEDLLKTENIGTLVSGDDASCGKGCKPSVHFLNVRREEAGDAMAIIETEYHRSLGMADYDTSHCDAVFNPEAEEALCPACGHRFAASGGLECPDCGLCFG